MKRKILYALLVFMFIFVGCSNKSTSGDNSLKEIKDKGVLIVGLDDSFPPMGFRDEAGEIVGFDVDMAKEVAKRMGIKAEFKPIDWDAKELSLSSKEIDVIWNGLTITEDRKKNMGFSKPYLANNQIIIVKADSAISAKADLKYNIVGLQMQSSSEDALNKDTELVASLKEVRKYANNMEALLDLESGRTSAVVIDEIVGRYYIAKKEGQFKVLDESLASEEYGVGCRLEDVSFITELDKILDEMKADGTANDISTKWFGSNIVK